VSNGTYLNGSVIADGPGAMKVRVRGPSLENCGSDCTHCYRLPPLFTVSLWAQNLPFQKILSPL